jgi:hypothetical protein
MTRTLTVVWPDRKPFEGRDGAPIRLLAVSDDVDPALDYAINREKIGHVDAIVGAGDLEPSYLAFLGDAFCTHVAYIRGNHDRGGHWMETLIDAPQPLSSGELVEVLGITVAPFEWPGLRQDRATRNEPRAWLDVLRISRSLFVRRLRGRRGPVLVLSHAPPRGVGDCESDPYHVGFAGYRWLLERIRPPLWLHGHTTPASVADWRDRLGPSVVANVTGSVLVELSRLSGQHGLRPPAEMALVGRSNVGKSSLVNAMVGAERVLWGSRARIGFHQSALVNEKSRRCDQAIDSHREGRRGAFIADVIELTQLYIAGGVTIGNVNGDGLRRAV